MASLKDGNVEKFISFWFICASFGISDSNISFLVTLRLGFKVDICKIDAFNLITFA